MSYPLLPTCSVHLVSFVDGQVRLAAHLNALQVCPETKDSLRLNNKSLSKELKRLFLPVIFHLFLAGTHFCSGCHSLKDSKI